LHSELTGKWPDYTCVLAYIDRVLREIGNAFPEQVIARHLKIRVPKDADNPFGYETTSQKEEYGISEANVIENIPQILKKYAPDYFFCLIKIEQIIPGMYEEFIRDVLQSQAILAIGYDYSSISGEVGESLHVSFVCEVSNGHINLIDYYIDKKGKKIEVDYPTIIQSIRRISGGFWIVSSKENLNNLSKSYEF